LRIRHRHRPDELRVNNREALTWVYFYDWLAKATRFISHIRLHLLGIVAFRSQYGDGGLPGFMGTASGLEAASATAADSGKGALYG
jgi:hypothetical protein